MNLAWNFYVHSWPFIHCLCFSNTHKNLRSSKNPPLQILGGNPRGQVPRMPLHHPTYFRYPFFSAVVRLLSGANCLIPPSPFSIKVKSLICPSEEAWLNGIYYCFLCNSPGLTDCTTAGKIVDVTDKVRVQGSTTATSKEETFR